MLHTFNFISISLFGNLLTYILAGAEDNAQDFVSSGGLKELIRISSESSREDIRNLAKKTLRMNPAFRAEMHTELL